MQHQSSTAIALIMTKRHNIQRAFSKHAHHYDRHAIIQQHVSQSLADMLDHDPKPAQILDLGAGTGCMTQHLTTHFPNALCVALDIALPMVQRAQVHAPALQADAQQLPFADQSMDMICSNLMLQWLPTPTPLLEECWRVLKPGGRLYVSTLGTDTLHEAKMALSAIDRAHHINRFHDIHQLGDQLQRLGWQQPVLQQTWLQQHHTSPQHVFLDLKNIGASTVQSTHQALGLTTPNMWQRCLNAYPKNSDGKYVATYHAICLRALRGTDRPPETISVPIDSIQRPKRNTP